MDFLFRNKSLKLGVLRLICSNIYNRIISDTYSVTGLLTLPNMQYSMLTHSLKGLSIKKSPQSGKEGVCPVRNFSDKGGRGFFRCGRPHFFAQKIRILCPHGQGGWASTDIFRISGEGFNFSRFCADVFSDGP